MLLHGRSSRLTRRLALCVVALAVHSTANAESPPGEDAAIAAEVAATLPRAPRESLTTPAASARPHFWLGRFVDHLDVRDRLSQIKSLKLVPLWDTRRLSIFFGVNHHGMPGLHIQQQDPGFVARTAALEPPDAPVPLRAVPLNPR